MKTIKRLLHVTLPLIVLLSMFFLGAPIARAADTRFVPMGIGQTFTYNARNNIGNTWTEKMSVNGFMVIGVAIPPTKAYCEIDTSEGTESSTVSMRSTSTSVYQYAGFGREYVVWQNGGVGTTWSYTDLKGRTIQRTIEAIETVTVPAGTYDGCLRFKNQCTSCADANAYWYEWVKPGFTMVKWKDYWVEQNGPVVYQLKSWTP